MVIATRSDRQEDTGLCGMGWAWLSREAKTMRTAEAGLIQRTWDYSIWTAPGNDDENRNCIWQNDLRDGRGRGIRKYAGESRVAYR